MHNEDNSEQQHFMMMQPQGMFAEAQRFHELQVLEVKAAMESFLDELTADQCISLARMMQLISHNPNNLHVIAGQLSAIIRIVHKVCATCGDTRHSTMEHISATDGDLSPAPADLGFLVGLSKDEQMKKLYVRSDTAATLTSSGPIEVFVCQNCDTAYASLLDRAQAGRICMICQQNKVALADEPDMKLELGDLMTRYGVSESYTVEDGVFCLGCDTEFPTLKHRIMQGKNCPVCDIQPEVERDEGSSEPS